MRKSLFFLAALLCGNPARGQDDVEKRWIPVKPVEPEVVLQIDDTLTMPEEEGQSNSVYFTPMELELFLARYVSSLSSPTEVFFPAEEAPFKGIAADYSFPNGNMVQAYYFLISGSFQEGDFDSEGNVGVRNLERQMENHWKHWARGRLRQSHVEKFKRTDGKVGRVDAEPRYNDGNVQAQVRFHFHLYTNLTLTKGEQDFQKVQLSFRREYWSFGVYHRMDEEGVSAAGFWASIRFSPNKPDRQRKFKEALIPRAERSMPSAAGIERISSEQIYASNR
ncbi:hypothetical protein HYS48_03925 [Candidatus Woesearchaeota archaeon]|nr:hypothetical protein [Candidatus Woesearchaeota archaeon]